MVVYARIIDANLNRLREACRVLEDILRYGCDEKQACAKIKSIRHQLRLISERHGLVRLLDSRGSDRDVGKALKEKGEMGREDIYQVWMANMKRAQEAARVLEEFFKIDAQSQSAIIKSMRYQLYELEKKYFQKRVFGDRVLYVLITQSLCRKNPMDVVKACMDAGADWIQLREKEMEDAEFLKWIEKVQRVMKDRAHRLIINDRISLARLSHAGGVHLGQGDLSTRQARELLYFDQLLGRSTHNISQARRAAGEKVDYIGVGPIFPTLTKQHRRAVGMKYLEAVKKINNLAYVGIGSINRATIEQVLEHRPTGVAICTGIISARDPAKECRFFRRKLDREIPESR